MPRLANPSGAVEAASTQIRDIAEPSRLAERLTVLLSVIAGMVELIGFLTLGNIFTARASVR